MTKESAREKARTLCFFQNRTPNRIAATLMRAFAEGMEYAAECELAAQMGSLDTGAYRSPEDIRAEADAVERGEG